MQEVIASLEVANRLLKTSSICLLGKESNFAVGECEYRDQLIQAFRKQTPAPFLVFVDLARYSDEALFWQPFLFSGRLLVKCLDWFSSKSIYLILIDTQSKEPFSERFYQDLSSVEQMLLSLSPFSYKHSQERNDLLELLNNLPLLVSQIDQNQTITYVNQGHEAIFHKKVDDMVGLKLQELVGAELYTLIEKPLLKALSGDKISFQHEIRHGLNQEARIIRSSYVPRGEGGEVTGIYACIQDVTAQQRTLNTLRKLHSVTANQQLTLDEKLEQILLVGVEQFALPLGIISSIRGDVYRIEYCVSPAGELSPGMVFDLGETYCVHTLNSDAPTAFYHVAQSAIKAHPCYRNFGLESYIGMAVFVNGKRWGTLNFSSPHPKGELFGEDDLELMKLLAQWVGNEITREHSMQALLEQKKLFESLFVDAPSVIILTDKDRRIKMVNPAFTDLFGYQPEEVIGKVSRMLYASDDVFSNIEEKLKNSSLGGVITSHLACQDKWGRVFFSEAAGEVIRGADGEIEAYIGHLRDITDRLKAEQDIVEANQRLSMAADSAGIGVWEWEFKGNKLVWDSWMYRLFGVSEQIAEEPYSIWEHSIYPDDKESLDKAIEEAIETHRGLDIDFRITRMDGQIRYLKANAITIYDDEGVAVSMTGVNLDVTSRKETEQVLRKARKEAEAASKAKSHFLATVSHEIRTPLNGVLGMAELLAGSPLSEEQSNQLKVLRESGESLLELINEILDFSKIESGQLSIEYVDFDLEKAVYDVARMLMVKAEEKGIDLLIEYPDSPSRLFVGDVFRIKQVLINLVGNAIKFTNKGHVIVCVNIVSDRVGNAKITLHVQDTGVGIEEKVQSSLFKAFTQADSSTTRRFGGTGLGLAITKQLVELMGGDIALQSQVGVGSRFSVSLVLPESHSYQITHAFDASLWANSKTLVVDDNATNLAIICNQLASLSIIADSESNPMVAYQSIVAAVEHGSPYEIIILDYLMPELDGLMLCRLIREFTGSMNQPVILMASSSGQLTKESILEAGVNVSTLKPMDTHSLRRGLEVALSSPVLGKQLVHADVSIPLNEVHEDRQFFGTVLVVEDMLANLKVAKGILAQMGVSILTAENGAQAIEQWQKHQPDVILMDLHMPVMDGIMAMRTIRQKEKRARLSRVPIYALTADALVDRLSQVIRAGGDGLITKPFKKKDLYNAFEDCLMEKTRVVAKAEPGQLAEQAFLEVKTEKVIDMEILKELKSTLGSDMTLLVETFFLDGNTILETLQSCVDDAIVDYDVIFKASHSMKSISRNLGGIYLSECAAQLEKESLRGNIKNLKHKVNRLTDSYQQFTQALRKAIGSL